MKMTKIYNDAKDKNVAKTVLFYASNDETKTLYYEPTLENEVAKKDLVDFFLKGLVIQAVTEGVPTGEYEMPTTLGEEKGGSGGSVEPVVLYGYSTKNGQRNVLFKVNPREFNISSAEDELNYLDYLATEEEILSAFLSGPLFVDYTNVAGERGGTYADNFDFYLGQITTFTMCNEEHGLNYAEVTAYKNFYSKNYYLNNMDN